ncbi:MAG: FAD-dependent oxidoreductase, partial [Actinomycetota bacterium]|nr:FAD-dependent oxidoreductase [Actinomycetota bacterium]
VVLAVPARPAARLLSDVAPGAARLLASLDYASLALATLAFRAGDLHLPGGSGFLVPAVERRVAKAATFTTAKWGWYAESHPDVVLVRLSVGRLGEERDLQRDDGEILTAVRADLRDIAGVTAAPVDSRVVRWGGALPQYAVGHLDLVRRVRTEVAGVPGLAVCGAAYDGVGIPACISSARRASADVLSSLPADRGDSGGG